MTYPSQTTIRSYGGACPPSYLGGSLAGSYTAGQTFTLHSASGWYEVDANGQATTNPLGTSGPFTVVVDFSTATEEKVLCSAVNVATGVVTVWTDGTNNGRGYDGTTISAHSAGSTPNCFPVATAVENKQLNAGVVSALATASSAQSTANTALANAATAQSTANTAEADAQTGIANAASAQGTANTALANAATAQATANSKVASVTAGDTTITIAGTATAPTVAVSQANLTIAESQVTGLGSDLAAKALKTTTISTTAPLAGGGDLSANRTLSIADASTTVKGAVQLTDSTSSISTTTAATPNSVKSAYDLASTANTTANAAVPKTTTISTTAPLAGGGDLSANRTLSIADASTTAKGAVQLTDSTASTSTTTAATPNSVKTAYDLANAAVPNTRTVSTTSPLTGGGALSSNLTLAINAATTSQAGAVQLTDSLISTSTTTAATPNSLQILTKRSPGTVVPSFHSTSGQGPMIAWNQDPATVTLATNTMTSGTQWFTALTLPYDATINYLWVYQSTGAVKGTTSPYYGMSIYNTSGTQLGTTGNLTTNINLVGALAWQLTAPLALTAGTYIISFFYYTGTGGSPVTPVFNRIGGTISGLINVNVPTPSAGKLDQRSCQIGSLTTPQSPISSTPTQSGFAFWTAVS